MFASVKRAGGNHHHVGMFHMPKALEKQHMIGTILSICAFQLMTDKLDEQSNDIGIVSIMQFQFIVHVIYKSHPIITKEVIG